MKKTSMKKLFFYTFILTTALSCRRYPDYDKLTSKPIVLTNHDASINFSNYKTYYLADKITLIGDNPKDTVVSSTIGDPIINAINENMASNGYSAVKNSALADLVLNTAVITITTTVTSYPPYYWWGYPGYGYGGYYPYYGYGGGYYGYGYSYSYSYQTGSLMIQMGDRKNAANNKMNIVWINFNTGVMGNTADNVQEGVNSINQAFKQSEYLKRN